MPCRSFRIICFDPEKRDLAVAVPKLNVVAIEQLLGLYLGLLIIRAGEINSAFDVAIRTYLVSPSVLPFRIFKGPRALRAQSRAKSCAMMISQIRFKGGLIPS
jgi:hypothetical protein